MFFDNIRLYIDNQDTGRLKVKYVCKECGKEMDKAEHWTCPCLYGAPQYHNAEFMCDECKNKLTT